MKLYDKGFRFKFGEMEYEKTNDDEWGHWTCLTSNYLVDKMEMNLLTKKEEKTYELRSEMELPIEKRFGFRWTDEQVKKYYFL